MNNLLEDLKAVLTALKTEYEVDNALDNRCYILPDGSVLHIPQFNVTHQCIKNTLKDVYNLPDEDIQILNDNLIRVNLRGEGILGLPKNEPTKAQYDTLMLTMDKYLKSGCWRTNKFTIIEPYDELEKEDDRYIPQSKMHFYDVYGNDMITDDYIKVIENFYRTGIFRE